jgi:hypothetical protein
VGTVAGVLTPRAWAGCGDDGDDPGGVVDVVRIDEALAGDGGPAGRSATSYRAYRRGVYRHAIAVLSLPFNLRVRGVP